MALVVAKQLARVVWSETITRLSRSEAYVVFRVLHLERRELASFRGQDS